MSFPDVVTLTQQLVAIPSASQISNAPVSDTIQEQLERIGFTVERESYTDEFGEKINLLAKLGEGSGGLAFCSHSDTVPGQEEDWDPYDPAIIDNRLYGRGSCDMKGPLAATMVAAASVDPERLRKPMYIVVTSDEELGLTGANFLAEQRDNLLMRSRPEWGIIAEPTSMVPVYAHKGFGRLLVTAHGRAAHSSTGKGISANLLIAPFLADVARLSDQINRDESFMNHEFDPPTQTLNMVIDDGNCQLNVTAPKTVCGISFRAMPNSRSQELVEMMCTMAEGYGFDVDTKYHEALYISPESELVQSALQATGKKRAATVPYGTDGVYLQSMIEELVVLGPGDIGVAHTTSEFVPLVELHDAVRVYRELIARFCL